MYSGEYDACDVTLMMLLMTFPGGGKRSARRKPTTFGRALTHSLVTRVRSLHHVNA